MNNQPTRQEITKEMTKHFKGFVITFLIAFFIFALLAIVFKNPIRHFVNNFVDQTGFIGMCLISFVSGLIVTPVPQETFIFMIEKSHLNDNWIFYVFVFGLVSLVAGHICWVLGKKIGKTNVVQKMLGKNRKKVEDLVSRFGFWGVFIGIFSPLPFSVLCWGSGILEVPWVAFTIASSFRMLRFFIMYYLLKMT